MKSRQLSVVAILAILAILCVPSTAQTLVGIEWLGTTSVATPACGSFTCVPIPVNVVGGETVSVRVRGSLGSAYLIAVASTASSCAPIGGIQNMLVLDVPAGILVAGTMDFPELTADCSGGFALVTGTLPLATPPGTTFSIQAVAISNGFAAFTSAITVTVM